MPENIRALIVVLTLAVPAFYVGSQLAISVISAREFAVWRNVWFAATVAAFLSGNFYVFAAIEIMICLYANAARAATVAVFVVLLLAIPLIDLPIGGLGFFNWLLDLNNARLLAIVFLLPLLMFATGRSDRHKRIVFSMPDRMILCYALPLIALNVASFAQFARSAAEFSLDVLIPYFAFSRLITNVADLRKVSLAFVIAVLPLSLIGVFESAKGWLLYSSFIYEWRGDIMMRYLLRADRPSGKCIQCGFDPVGLHHHGGHGMCARTAAIDRIAHILKNCIGNSWCWPHRHALPRALGRSSDLGPGIYGNRPHGRRESR